MLKIIEPTMQTKSDAKSKQSENCAEKTPSPCGPPICVTAIGTTTVQAIKTIDGKMVFNLNHFNKINIGISAANKPTKINNTSKIEEGSEKSSTILMWVPTMI